MIINPWAATSSRIDVYIKDSAATTLESATFYIDYVASALDSCSIDGGS